MGANLMGANMKNTICTVARYNLFTQWPDSFNPLDAGAIQDGLWSRGTLVPLSAVRLLLLPCVLFKLYDPNFIFILAAVIFFESLLFAGVVALLTPYAPLINHQFHTADTLDGLWAQWCEHPEICSDRPLGLALQTGRWSILGVLPLALSTILLCGLQDGGAVATAMLLAVLFQTTSLLCMHFFVNQLRRGHVIRVQRSGHLLNVNGQCWVRNHTDQYHREADALVISNGQHQLRIQGDSRSLSWLHMRLVDDEPPPDGDLQAVAMDQDTLRQQS